MCGVAGCDCKANWTYAGETWHGCANPGNNWPSAWCYVNTSTCLPGAWACAIEQGLWCAALLLPAQARDCLHCPRPFATLAHLITRACILSISMRAQAMVHDVGRAPQQLILPVAQDCVLTQVAGTSVATCM